LQRRMSVEVDKVDLDKVELDEHVAGDGVGGMKKLRRAAVVLLGAALAAGPAGAAVEGTVWNGRSRGLSSSRA
jgi:hypothetical protein